MTQNRPRLPPLPPERWPKEMRQAMGALRPPNADQATPRREDRPKGLNILGTLARHPELTRAFFTFNGHVLSASTLSARHRELLVLSPRFNYLPGRFRSPRFLGRRIQTRGL